MTVVQFSHPTLHDGVQYNVGDQASVDDIDAWRLVNAGYATYVDPAPDPPETPDPYPQYVLHEELAGGGAGEAGEAGTIELGTVTTGAPGSPVTITNVGTVTHAIWNISIPQGLQGTTGFKGWSPVFAIVSDGARRVLQIVDWFGGEGVEPSSTNQFLGPTGIVGTAAAAVDIRGPAGSGGGGSAGIVDVIDHGAVLNGTTDDTAALQAACTAAYNAGGGTVVFSGRMRVNGDVTVWRGVSLQGRGRTDSNGTSPANTIVITGTGRLLVGQGNRGGDHGNFSIECNGAGHTGGVLVFSAVWQTLKNIMIEQPAGIGLKVLGQNCYMESVDTLSAGTDGLVIDDGAGGLRFSRCSFGSSTGWDIRITETTPGSHPSFGYQYGPAHIVFDTCITENYQATACEGLVLLEAGTRATFRNHGFSNSSDTTFNSGYQIKILNDKFASVIGTTVEFNSCNYHGGNTHKYPPFYVQGTNAAKNHLILTGYNAVQYATSVFNTDGMSQGSVGGVVTYVNCDSIFGTLTGANWIMWRTELRTGVWYRMPASSGAWAGTYPIMVGRDNENGARLMIGSDGGLYWASGANLTPLMSLIPDPVNALVQMNGRWDTGRVFETETTFTVPSTGYSYSQNAALTGPIHAVLVQGTATLTSWAITNAVNWQRMTFMLYRSGSQTFTLPTNFRFANNTAPGLAAGTRTYLTMRYKDGIWYEVGRSADVPNT